MSEKKPYKETTFENCVIRTFTPDVEIEDLKWHRDHEDRIVIPLNDNDWLYQEDNKLPVPIKEKFSVPMGTWHRIIKGTTKLIVMIEKIKPA